MDKFEKLYKKIKSRYGKKLREEVVYVQDGHLDPDSEYDQEDFFDQVEKLEKKSPITVSRNKELVAVYMDKGKLVATLYLEETGDEFSFDIIIGDKHQGKGIGSKMIDIALSVYNLRKDENDEIKVRLDVSNTLMKNALEKRGFDVKEEAGGDRWIMGEIDPDEEPEEKEVKSDEKDLKESKEF